MFDWWWRFQEWLIPKQRAKPVPWWAAPFVATWTAAKALVGYVIQIGTGLVLALVIVLVVWLVFSPFEWLWG